MDNNGMFSRVSAGTRATGLPTLLLVSPSPSLGKGTALGVLWGMVSTIWILNRDWRLIATESHQPLELSQRTAQSHSSQTVRRTEPRGTALPAQTVMVLSAFSHGERLRKAVAVITAPKPWGEVGSGHGQVL